jgi:ketopantoate reductase
MSREIERAFVIGMGEVGRRLAAALAAAGIDVVGVSRDEGWERALSGEPGPRIICVREEALAGVLERLRDVPVDRLVAVQNGWIRPLVAKLPELSRGLIWFTSKGGFYRVLRPSPISGKWAPALASLLTAGGIPASAVPRAAFDALDADKMGFNCVVGLPLAVHGLSLGEYLEREPDEARELFMESVTTCARAVGTAAEASWWIHFLESSTELGWVRTGRAKALELRNGAVAELARRQGVPVPVTDRLLEAHAAGPGGVS